MARNREAYHEYFVEEEIEAGIELVGTEVKSIRAGTLNLKDAWCGIKDGDMLLNQMHISPYDTATASTLTPAAPAVCCCTSGRSCGSTARSSRTATP